MPLAFLGIDGDRWIGALQQAVAHVLRGGEVQAASRCLTYLYTQRVDHVAEDLALEFFARREWIRGLLQK